MPNIRDASIGRFGTLGHEHGPVVTGESVAHLLSIILIHQHIFLAVEYSELDWQGILITASNIHCVCVLSQRLGPLLPTHSRSVVVREAP